MEDERWYWGAATVALFTLGAMFVGELVAHGIADALRVLLIAGVSGCGLWAMMVICRDEDEA